MSNYLLKAQTFLEIANQFKLGELTTESFHPKTVGLSETSKLNLSEAIFQFKSVDREMLEALESKASEIENLSQSIQSFLKKSKGRLFLCGCGATGRLSLSLEFIWKSLYPDQASRVISLMAGGDAALVSSIEKFEDYPEFAHRQLQDLSFSPDDFLIAITEGGETPWVIGACEYAANLSQYSPYFVYCNEDEKLFKIDRSQNVLQNPNIIKLNLTHCAQALSGSTRLQASSIQMAAVGFAMTPSTIDIKERLRYFKDWYLNLDLERLAPFITDEAQAYQRDKVVHYFPDEALAISVFTDTTERSPTFNFIPFESQQDVSKVSRCYIILSDTKDAQTSWSKLLGREPRPLEWRDEQGVVERAGLERIYSFDFSRHVIIKRAQYLKKVVCPFYIRLVENVLTFELESHQAFFEMPKQDGFLITHLILKMMMNMHSTLLMGRLGRYESNIMTWVKPSNNKLIDRAVRYAEQILKQDGYSVSYEELVKECFRLLEEGKFENESIVLKMVHQFKLQ